MPLLQTIAISRVRQKESGVTWIERRNMNNKKMKKKKSYRRWVQSNNHTTEVINKGTQFHLSEQFKCKPYSRHRLHSFPPPPSTLPAMVGAIIRFVVNPTRKINVLKIQNKKRKYKISTKPAHLKNWVYGVDSWNKYSLLQIQIYVCALNITFDELPDSERPRASLKRAARWNFYMLKI